MQVLNADQTRNLLPWSDLVAGLREMLASMQGDSIVAPPRTALSLADSATLLLMPATSPKLTITKLVTVHPRNHERSLPSVQADVLVMDTQTGQRLCLLDGSIVTARRTAAVSLLAAQMLAPDPQGTLLIVGAGTQGRSHLEAFTAELPVRRVLIASRSRAHAEALVEHAAALGVDAQIAADLDSAAAEASLIVTATTSTQPVLPTTVRPDAFIAAVGAYRPDMAELPPDLVRQAAVYVDTLEGAHSEAGDLLQAGVDWTSVTPLAADLARPLHGPVLFKSVGHALWDLAAAQIAIRGLDRST